MSQNEQAPKKNDEEDSDVNKTEDDNKNENSTNNEDETSQVESNSSSNTNTRAPPKRASASVKSHPSHTSRGAPSFESQMSPEQIETNLIKLFGNKFPDAAKDEDVLSDGLSVRDLRIIVRVLKLCGPSQVNVRKPILCDFLMKHMQNEHMTESYKKFTEEKERARLARQKIREEKTKHVLETQTQNSNYNTKETTPASTSTTVLATTRSQARHIMNEKANANSIDRRSNQQNQRTTSTAREKHPIPSISSGSSNYSNVSQNGINSVAPNSNLSSHVTPIIPLTGLKAAASIVVNSNANMNSASLLNPAPETRSDACIIEQTSTNQDLPIAKTRYVKEVTLPRLKLDSTFDIKNALDILQKCNEFVLMISDRLTEMERAISIMTFKVAELEKLL